MIDKSILTISSNVIHGYVGNKSISFPLQTLGWNINIINTVNYSNHTGYGRFDGTMTTSDTLTQLLNNEVVTKVNFIITGYLPNSKIIQTVEQFLQTQKPRNTVYLFDPILGDEGQLYVDQSCIHSYKHLLNNTVIDIITPNQFELETLSDIKINDWSSCLKAIEWIQPKVDFVVLTSVKFPDDKSCIYIFGSTQGQIQYFKVPLIDCYFTGVGDLFTAILMEKLYNNYFNASNLTEMTPQEKMTALMKSINQVLYVMGEVLKSTAEKGAEYGKARMGDLIIGQYELNVIESRDLFHINKQEYSPKVIN